MNKRVGLLRPEDEGNAILRNDGYYAPNGCCDIPKDFNLHRSS